MSMSITWWSLVNSPCVVDGRPNRGWSTLVGGGGGMVDVAIRDTIRAHFGQYPPEHQHTSITSRLTAGNFCKGRPVMKEFLGEWMWWGEGKGKWCARWRRREGESRGDGLLPRLDMFPSIYAPIPPHSMQVANTDFSSGDFFVSVFGLFPQS